MLKVKKWNLKNKEYEECNIPLDWHCPLCTSDMKEKINCISCGKIISFGEAYTSRLYHTDHGFAFSVCPDCHEKEMKEELLNGKY